MPPRCWNARSEAVVASYWCSCRKAAYKLRAAVAGASPRTGRRSGLAGDDILPWSAEVDPELPPRRRLRLRRQAAGPAKLRDEAHAWASRPWHCSPAVVREGTVVQRLRYATDASVSGSARRRRHARLPALQANGPGANQRRPRLGAILDRHSRRSTPLRRTPGPRARWSTPVLAGPRPSSRGLRRRRAACAAAVDRGESARSARCVALACRTGSPAPRRCPSRAGPPSAPRSRCPRRSS